MGSLSLETIYFYGLLVCAGIAILLFLFGDIFEFDGPLDPMLIVPWLAFVSLVGFLGERLTTLSSLFILLIGVALATILVFLLNFYVLVPLKNSESTLSTTEKSFEGRVATVVTPIPITGMGEIKISSVTGSTTRPASFYEEQTESIKNGNQVLIIEVRNHVCYVVPYNENFIS
ncbi:hypothetical protein [Vagococcus sp.]|uniref:hypothetical protein n=1 Tax=Vagococcus sp. TaxID=1933889 RepID=UPI000EDF4F1A|nr:hypothetical protein [Vagococcus sp.]HCT95931.1 hypothetical protein [Vagococcus sp.]